MAPCAKPSVKPQTPLSPGRPAPPRITTPASVLNSHKLVGGATRVVMKHQDEAPRPKVSFGGQSMSAVAMLVGGGLELPLPLYCVDDVSKALVDLLPEVRLTHIGSARFAAACPTACRSGDRRQANHVHAAADKEGPSASHEWSARRLCPRRSGSDGRGGHWRRSHSIA